MVVDQSSPPALEVRPDEEVVKDSVTLRDALLAGSLARVWAKYTAGPRAGERVLVLALAQRTPTAVLMTPLAEIIPYKWTECLVALPDDPVKQPEPRIVIVPSMEGIK